MVLEPNLFARERLVFVAVCDRLFFAQGLDLSVNVCFLALGDTARGQPVAPISIAIPEEVSAAKLRILVIPAEVLI